MLTDYDRPFDQAVALTSTGDNRRDHTFFYQYRASTSTGPTGPAAP